jgi:predicted nucleotide-binding protein
MSHIPSFINVTLPNQKKKRQIFVAYSYRLYPQDDYRKVYTSLEKAFNVKFIFADEQISSLHILQKICNYIRESEFGIYDISGWNPNVTLELGLALGLPEKCFIAINPEKTNVSEVPSDLRGVDRMEY